jgi:peptide/nickel transport system permease protein
VLIYALRRLVQLGPVLLAVVVLNFFLIHAAPGDPATYLAGDTAGSSAYLNQIRAEFGLNQPVWIQLLIYLDHVLHGDLGYSFVSREPVIDVLLSRLPATLLLIGVQFSVAIVGGILLGVASARRRGGWLDHLVALLSLIGFAVPAFWLAQMLMLLFSLKLDWLPPQGMYSLRYDLKGTALVLDVAQHLILPATTLALFNLALISRITRASMSVAMQSDYITFARSKGVTETAVAWRHGFRNALVPVVTIIGLHVRTLITGAVLTETVFAWPGIGRLTYEAVLARDYPVLMGALVLVSVTVVIANIATDLLCAWLDPRIRLQ